MATPTDQPTRDRLDDIIAEQEDIFLARQPRSRELGDRARRCLAGGATSSWQITRPQVVWLSHAAGSKVFDADGTEYVDMHGGYGVSAVGHAHAAIVRAVRERVALGTHFAQPTEDAIVVAEELASRFGLPLWRFGNSGTESTMDAVRLMRAVTGRDVIIKVEGCYHGAHDPVLVSVLPGADQVGPPDEPTGVPATAGVPSRTLELTALVGFNDLSAVQRVLTRYSGRVAGMIVEPIMMNAGIIPPLPGYLAGLRTLLHAHGALLTFDEVKTGLTVGPGGATARTGVVPDIVCLAKAIGGGVAVSAIGGTTEVMAHVADGRYQQVGTFNGNPLAMAAARATLREIMLPGAYAHLDRLQQRLADGAVEVIARTGLPAHVVVAGAKGCISFAREPVRHYRDFLRIDDRFSHAHWLFQHNGGVFLPPWGKAEQWLLSVQHTDADVDRFLANFARFAEAVGTSRVGQSPGAASATPVPAA
jgi:glutamate-1-semialdehyde 2,1-aminomutase